MTVNICGWDINKSRTVATKGECYDEKQKRSITLSDDGRTIRLVDHEDYYPDHAHEIPLAVIEALRPGGTHPDWEWEGEE